MHIFIYCLLLVLSGCCMVSSSRVLEMSDKFIDLSKEGSWFVKFYAPWCTHCRRLDPIWAHVAQSLYSTPIKVAKIDCTRFVEVVDHFKIRAYPTLMFVKGAIRHEYFGERTKEDMVEYAIRMSQPAIQRLTPSDSIGYLQESHTIFFGYVGKQQGILWEMFAYLAEIYQPHTWFYSMSSEIIKNEISVSSDATIFVSKEEELYFFQASSDLLENKQTLNDTLDRWINAERFGLFPKITRTNIKHLMDTQKYIVMAVVSENRLSEIMKIEKEFRDMIEGIIKNRRKELEHRFQFGWTGSTDLANSIAMSVLTVPHLLVINSSTGHHHLPDEDPGSMTPETVLSFLEQILNQKAPVYGGNSIFVRIYRLFFEARTSLSSMWQGNPVLTALVFGLPLGFLSLICYSICCADILDAADEEDNTDTHEKKD